MKRLWSASILLMLLLGGPLAPSAFMAVASTECSMACCVEDGFCCCNMSGDEDSRPSGPLGMNAAQMIEKCPDDCAAPGQASKLQTRDSLRPACCGLNAAGPVIGRGARPISSSAAVYSSAAAPRAPPSGSPSMS